MVRAEMFVLAGLLLPAFHVAAETPDVSRADITATAARRICVDTDGDANNTLEFGCWVWDILPSYCAIAGYYDDVGFTAADMCCACGGGVDMHPAVAAVAAGPSHGPWSAAKSEGPSHGPWGQMAREPSHGPWDQMAIGPSHGPWDQMASGPSHGPWGQAATGPSHGPWGDIAATTSICVDTDGDANNTLEYGCWMFDIFRSYCFVADYYDDVDFTAADMCCACGGGAAAATASDGPWSATKGEGPSNGPWGQTATGPSHGPWGPNAQGPLLGPLIP